MGTWTDGGSMLSVDMGVDIHLCFLFGGDLGVYSISIYIFLYTPCTIQHILYDSTFYSCFCSWLNSPSFSVQDSGLDGEMRWTTPTFQRFVWDLGRTSWWYTAERSEDGGTLAFFPCTTRVEFGLKLFCRFNFGCPRVSIFFWVDMIYSYPLHLCMVFIYIYILIYHKKLTIHVGRSTSHMDDTVDAWTPKQPPGDV